MPNLLGNYDCGDEPEEEDDSVNDQNDDESGESENDDISQIKQDDFSSPKKENELNPYNDDLEPELKMDGEKNEIEFGEDGFSGQSTQITNNEQLRYLTSLGSAGNSALNIRRKRLGSKKKKARKPNGKK